jgi:hypothetical protein
MSKAPNDLSQPWPDHITWPATTATNGTSELAALSGSVLPWWVTRKWDAEVCECVRCGTTMRLNPDCEWDDDEEYNLCHNCSLELLKEAVARLNTQAE